MYVSITKLKAEVDQARRDYGPGSGEHQQAKKALRAARQARRDERGSRMHAYDERRR
jgi:hypothetical protein